MPRIKIVCFDEAEAIKLQTLINEALNDIWLGDDTEVTIKKARSALSKTRVHIHTETIEEAEDIMSAFRAFHIGVPYRVHLRPVNDPHAYGEDAPPPGA